MWIQYFIATVLLAEACLAGVVRITDGTSAQPHEFPYQVSIVWGLPPLIQYRHVCGGSIITKDWILTAGHCVTEVPKIGHIAVQAGKHYIDRHEPGQENREISMHLVHHNYPGGVAQHDIALLRLKTPLTFNENVQPIALPKPNKMHKGKVILTGWGSTSKGWLPTMPRELQKADIPIVDYDTCFESFASINDKFELFHTQVCTGPIGGTVSACSGDSGGPLVQVDDHGNKEQVGIVSWGNYPCSSAGTPSVYTRVSSYIDWINAKIEAS